jgi:cyclopropane fatty-acyl-phospholipid synthase-like methyltransferase
MNQNNIFSTLIARQFRKPSGILGHYAAGFMKKNNQDYYRRVVELLEISDSDRILEVGCGAGFVVRMIAEQNTACRVDALDFSRLMLKKAGQTNRPWIRQGRIRLLSGDFGNYDFGRDRYTKIFAVNVLYFWENLGTMLAKLYALLEPKGRLVLFMSSPERLRKIPFAADGVFNKYSLEHVTKELLSSGFTTVRHETVLKKGMETFYIIADK